MNVQLPLQMDQQAFLAWVQRREERYELDRGRVILMTRGSRGHCDLTATAPVLIVEVLSPSSERIDLGDKAAEYVGIPSLLAYLVVAQDEMKAWVWVRAPTGFAPGADVLKGDEAVVHIEPLGIDLPLAAIYGRVRLP